MKLRLSRSGERNITNTPFDIDTMAPLLNANTVILPRPTPHPSFDGGVTEGKISRTQCKLMRHINDIRHLIQCMYNS